jgi:dienelactone hydrolase
MNIFDVESYNPGSELFPLRNELNNFVCRKSIEAFSSGDAQRDAVKTVEELESRKSFLRSKFIDAIGGLPPGDTPLNPKVTGVIECEDFHIEKVVFESRPKVFVTANLYMPYGITSPRGAVLFLCGHHKQAKHEPEYQIVCRHLVNEGLIVLALDPVGQGERLSFYETSIKDTTVEWGVQEHTYAGNQCLLLGDSIARYFLHDAMRGIDYLCSRPEVDAEKIGVTGNSGGGTQTSLVMVCDPRIAAAAPATFIMNRQSYLETEKSQDMEQIWPKVSKLGFDHEDILLMMAPKPVLVLAVKYDFFPIEGTRRTVGRAKRFWQVYDKENNLSICEDESHHMYTESLAKKAAQFFSIHLLSKDGNYAEKAVYPLAPSMLWCTKSGNVRGEIEGARFVYEENCQHLSEIESKQRLIEDDKRRKKAYEWLKDRVFSTREECELNPRIFEMHQFNALTLQVCIWRSQKSLHSNALLLRDYRFSGQELPVTVAIWEWGTKCIQPHIKWIRETCNSGRAVLVLDVSGEGALLPDTAVGDPPARYFFGSVYRLATDLIWLDDSLPAIRTYDVIRALDMIEAWPGLSNKDIGIYGYGSKALYGQLAAFLDTRISSLQVHDNIKSFAGLVRSRHYDDYDALSVNLPEVLKYFDIPDLKRWAEGD